MQSFEFQPRTRVFFGEGSLARLGEQAAGLGFHRSLLVADQGLVPAGHVDRASSILSRAGIEVVHFHDFTVNPDTDTIERGRQFAAAERIDSIVGLGGGSSLDCAKGINFVLTNGGAMRDYWGYGKATRPLLPMIGIPTTTGTGSEAQSYALVSDAATHVKMACGDPGAAFRVALLDPELAVSQPAGVLAAAGYDAISHAVETFVTTRRTPISRCFSREAWRLLAASFPRALVDRSDVSTIGAMMLGAHFAGLAIENSMLGAAHACANPLTARYGTLHGIAIALLLAHVVRWNAAAAPAEYAELLEIAGVSAPAMAAGDALARRLEELAAAAGLATRLRDAAISREDFPRLAQDAAGQWTGKFNPRSFDAAGALEVYECAW